MTFGNAAGNLCRKENTSITYRTTAEVTTATAGAREKLLHIYLTICY